MRNKSELEILDLKCKIEGLESLVEQKQSRIDQIQKMFDSSMKRHERGFYYCLIFCSFLKNKF